MELLMDFVVMMFEDVCEFCSCIQAALQSLLGFVKEIFAYSRRNLGLKKRLEMKPIDSLRMVT
jgi:hypothetical protein